MIKNKRAPCRFCSAIVLLLSSHMVQAEYYGLKIGDMRLNNRYSSNNVNGMPRMYAVVIGKVKGQGQAVEIEYSRTDSVRNALPADAVFSIDTYALYSVARTDSKTYFKSKIGYLLEKVTIDDVMTEDKGISFGIGFGSKMSGTSKLELEYTWVNSDLKLLSLSYIF